MAIRINTAAAKKPRDTVRMFGSERNESKGAMATLRVNGFDLAEQVVVITTGYSGLDELAGFDICRGMYTRIEKEGWPNVIFVEKNFNVKIGSYILRGGIYGWDSST